MVTRADGRKLVGAPQLASLRPPVAVLGRTVVGRIRWCRSLGYWGQGVQDIRKQGWLILFAGQHIVAVTRHNRFRDGGLAAHRVNRHRLAVEVQQVEQLWDNGDLVRFRIGLKLPQHQALRCGPRADQMQWRQSNGRIMRPAQGLAINGDDIIGEVLAKRVDPSAKTRLEGHRIKAGKHPGKRIMRGDAIGQVSKGAQPGLFVRAKIGNINPGVRIGDHGAERNG